MEWDAAEKGKSLLPSSSTEDEDDSERLINELRRAVAAATRAPVEARADAVAAARALVDRAAAPDGLDAQARRDLRAALRALERLERDGTPPERAAPGAGAAGPRQVQLQIDAEDAYSAQLERERAAEIARLAAQVSTVNQIYRDVASLVGAQQEDVDEIEELVARSHDRTTSGHRQLERAVRRRVQRHRCCAYLLCFLLLVIVLVVLAVIVARHVPAAR
jgi:hypothetical protein